MRSSFSLTDLIQRSLFVVASAAASVGCSNPDLSALRGMNKEDHSVHYGVVSNSSGRAAGYTAGNASFKPTTVGLEGHVLVADPRNPALLDGGPDATTTSGGDAGPRSDGNDPRNDDAGPRRDGSTGSHDGGSSDASTMRGSDAGLGRDGSTDSRDGGQSDGGVNPGTDAGTNPCDTPTRWYKDGDRDGYRTNEFLEGCVATGTFTLPVTALFDCDDEDETRFQYLNGARDADTDTFTLGEREPVCSGMELPLGWRSSRSPVEDCDDDVPTCTNDCTTVAYIDMDSDNYRGFETHRACDAPLQFRLRDADPLDCDDDVSSCTDNCATLVYVDGDGDGRRSEQPRRACDAVGDFLPESAPIDCDDHVTSCTEDCTALAYINRDGDSFRGRSSHRTCDAPLEYNLDETAPLDCDDDVHNTRLEDVVSCGPNNRGRQVRRCVDGVYQIEGECLPHDECVENTSRRISCSRNVGVCREGQETERCTYNAGENRFVWVRQRDCDGILPGQEDPENVPTLLDENCDSVIMRAYKIPVGLVMVGCDVTVDPPRCDGSGLPMHPAELTELREGNSRVMHRLLTDEIPLLLYRECVSQGICTEPEDRRSRTDNGYYTNPVKINGGYPVTATTWMQSRLFCAWLGSNARDIAEVQANPFVHRRLTGDLPTEAEWFMAANGAYAIRDAQGNIMRTGNTHATTHYAWGNESPDCTKANFRDPNQGDCTGDFQPVYTLPAGASFVGAHHLNGNGIEWLFNIFETYRGEPTSDPEFDPMGPFPRDNNDERVKIGGNYLRTEGGILTSSRNADTPNTFIRITAFRCVVRSLYEP